MKKRKNLLILLLITGIHVLSLFSVNKLLSPKSQKLFSPEITLAQVSSPYCF